MADDPNAILIALEKTPGNEEPKEPLVNIISGDRKDWVDKRPKGTLNSGNIDQWLDYVFSENGGTSYKSPLAKMLRGTRILGPGNQMAPVPDDTIGLVFVTRPLLNLSDENVKKHPQLISLYKPNKDGLNAYVKGLLDPRWGRNESVPDSLLDPYYPWIAPITNFVKVSSGFPDVTLNVDKSEPGIRKEVHMYPSGMLKVNWDFDMRMTFYNPKPNILPYIFDVWNHYIEAVTLGDEGMEPYPEALIQNYRDYDTRIYHMVLNKDMRSIEGIYCNAYSWPNSFPSGAFSSIDKTRNSLLGQGQDELDINFPSVGFRYNNVRVAAMFNQTTTYFNPRMDPKVRGQHYRKLKFSEYQSEGTSSYPWINLDTMELEYWSNLK